MSSQIYCVKCKQHTDTSNTSEVTTENNRKMIKGICKICGSKKSQFIKSNDKKDNKSAKCRSKKSSAIQLLREIYNMLVASDIDTMEKRGNGLFLGPFRRSEGYESLNQTIEKHGGILPLAALIPLISGILGGVGGLAGGVASAVNSTKANKEQERHNRAVEEQLKSGSGCSCKKGKGKGKGLFLGQPQSN